jgi:hypothetical protein
MLNVVLNRHFETEDLFSNVAEDIQNYTDMAECRKYVLLPKENYVISY